MVGVKAGVQIWEAGKRLPLDTVEWGGLRHVGEPSNRPLEMLLLQLLLPALPAGSLRLPLSGHPPSPLSWEDNTSAIGNN